jgi:hypothetical protein
MSTKQDQAPLASTTSDPSDRATGRRSRTARDAPSQAADPVAEAMRAEAVAAVTAPAPEPENFDGKDVLTLEELIARHGPATVAEVDSYLEGATLEQLTDDGTSVSTSRITRDGARIWGTISAFFLRATPAQRAHIPAVTDDFLRVAVWSTYQGQLAFGAFQDASATIAAARTGRNANDEDLRRRGGERRDVLYNGLRILAGQKGELRSQVEQAYRRSMQPRDIATTLRALVKLGREALADTSPAAVQRRRGSLIMAEFLTDSEGLATEVESIGRDAAAVPAPSPVSQADLDLWDGRNLAFLELAIDAFETAHAIDPSVPRLVPISLRSLLGTRRRVDKAASPPDAPSTPPRPPSTQPSPPKPPTTPPTTPA